MELLCPHCLKKVTVSDDKAGQVLNCPLCQGVFAAPSLAPVPTRMSAPPPMTAPPPVIAPPPQEPSEIPMLPVSSAPPPMPQQAAPPKPPPKPALPPADYTRRYGFCLRPDVLVCIPPVCLFLITLVFSFFPWHGVDVAVVNGSPLSLWGLTFGERSMSIFLPYTIFTFLALPVSIACVAFEFRLVPPQPSLAPLMPWKSAITLLLLFVTFVLFAYDYQQSMFATAVGSPIVFGEKVGFRLHFIAVVASGLELWVQSRKARNLPLPRFSVKL